MILDNLARIDRHVASIERNFPRRGKFPYEISTPRQFTPNVSRDRLTTKEFRCLIWEPSVVIVADARARKRIGHCVIAGEKHRQQDDSQSAREDKICASDRLDMVRPLGDPLGQRWQSDNRKERNMPWRGDRQHGKNGNQEYFRPLAIVAL